MKLREFSPAQKKNSHFGKESDINHLDKLEKVDGMLKKHSDELYSLEVSSVGKESFMDISKDDGAEIYLKITEPGELSIEGNSKGLLYLAEFLVAMCIQTDEHKSSSGFHIHLREEYGDINLKEFKGEIRNVMITNLDDRPIAP